MYKLDYLKTSATKAIEQNKEFVVSESVQVYIKDPLINGVNIRNILDKINISIPPHLTTEIDSIYVGIFDEFEEKETNAAYKDGAIYVSSQQEDEQDLLDDMVHEIAHSLEVPFGYLIYGDGELEQEFLSKRKKLYKILKKEGLKPNKESFLDLDFTEAMDNYLYKVVGYDRLNIIAASYSLFTSAYCATSLREYFANGFEYYFLDNPQYLGQICPVLYTKIQELHDYGEYGS
jgi:Mlc titration factor MtfA (ptsG expression regulator)